MQCSGCHEDIVKCDFCNGDFDVNQPDMVCYMHLSTTAHFCDKDCFVEWCLLKGWLEYTLTEEEVNNDSETV